MLQNTFIKKKLKKYTTTIPSKKFIIKYLTQKAIPISLIELAKELNIKNKTQLTSLHSRIRTMERDGQLIFTYCKSYAVPTCINLIKGKVIGHRDGFGFLRAEKGNHDYYLSNKQMKKVIHGDIIIAQLKKNNKIRHKVHVIRILIHTSKQIIGKVFIKNKSFFVIPYDNRFNFNIFIPPEKTKNAKKGFIVVVTLIQRPYWHIKAIGKITEILGNNMEINIAVNIALRTYNIPYIWPIEVEKQVLKFEKTVTEIDKKGRVDLRALPLITIDGEDAYDFDDAVYCEKIQKGGWRLWVAISDVSYYIKPNTPLDKETSKRATSIYFPSQVIPMIPEILSNGLCSLKPNVDRLCLVCDMTISSKGILSSYEFYEAIINSRAQLTYKSACNILKKQKTNVYCSSLIKLLIELNELYQVLEKARLQRGSIYLETEETKFILNADNSINRIELIKRNKAHKIIEECMIMANNAAACFVEKHKKPALYRVHDKPNYDDIISLRTTLSKFGLVLGGGDNPTSKDYANIISFIIGRKDQEILQTMLLRSMKQASYNPKNKGHFGLALSSYAHFTSPIRRYPDLSLHRIIKNIIYLQKKSIHSSKDIINNHWNVDQKKMFKLGEICSLKERQADEATRDVYDWLKCNFIKNYIGQIFSGIIINIFNFGFFVRLESLLIDGLVHVSSLKNDHYKYDNINQILIGTTSKVTYRLGDKIHIVVKSVNLHERKIYFLLNLNNYQTNLKNIKNNLILH